MSIVQLLSPRGIQIRDLPDPLPPVYYLPGRVPLSYIWPPSIPQYKLFQQEEYVRLDSISYALRRVV